VTLRKWKERERVRIEASQHEASVTEEQRHEHEIVHARANGIRNLTAIQYGEAARLARHKRKGYPLGAEAMFNGQSDPCDMWTGHCCCGAMHRDGI